MLNICLSTLIYYFAVIGVLITLFELTNGPQYAEICEFKNNYTQQDYRDCLNKNGCGSDGSLCSETRPYWFCIEPTIECKIIKKMN